MSYGVTSLCKNRAYSRDSGTGKLSLMNDIRSKRAYLYLEEGDSPSKVEMRHLYKKDRVREVYLYTRAVRHEPESLRAGTEACHYEHTDTLNISMKRTRKGSDIAIAVVLLIVLLMAIIALYLTLSQQASEEE